MDNLSDARILEWKVMDNDLFLNVQTLDDKIVGLVFNDCRNVEEILGLLDGSLVGKVPDYRPEIIGRPNCRHGECKLDTSAGLLLVECKSARQM